jgi:predicted RNA-binding Zn-ribbon protein involved in translation (DUF1610 family)
MSSEMKNNIGEMGFDSSLFDTIDSKLTPQEYRERLIQLLQPILDQRFPNSTGKRQIQPHHDRITFACPYCGDSMKSDYKRRGNFILKGKHNGFFKCHNCGEFKRIDHFFSDYHTELNLDAINFMMDNLGNFDSISEGKYDMSVFLDMDKLDKYAIDRQELLRHFGLVEAKDSPVRSWLFNRHQKNLDKFLYNPDKNYILILNLTQSGKILGAQKRVFKGENRFQTFKLSKLYELMNKKLDVDNEKKEYLDTLSMIFNICLINFNHPVTLFEGPMDAFLFKNAIANTGANKELPIDLPVRYLYDCDETGKKKAIEHLNNQHEVFLWGKFQQAMGFPYKSKWDWNDFIIWSYKNKIKIPLVDSYFSRDPLDIIDI